MARLPALLLLAVALSAASVRSSSFPTEVVELTDANFEHDTQASTGQTTGVWAVLFTDSNVKRHDRAVAIFEELAKDEDKEVIYAKVDVAGNRKLARRFGEVVLPPCVLLFRDRQMYLFDGSFDRDDVSQHVRDFVTSGFANQEPLDVPAPSEKQLNLQAFEASSQMDMKVVGIAVLMIVGGLLFQTWAIINKDKFKPEPSSQKQQQQQEKQQRK
ncbi:hypothetical protein Agub_g12065, partial [Astrephomene gubernaculifera]